MTTPSASKQRPNVLAPPTTATVLRSEELTPRMRRVTLGGESLRDYPADWPAAAIKLIMPLPGERHSRLPTRGERGPVWPDLETPPLFRPYTLRRFDPEAMELDLDVVLHGESPGSVWASTAQPGDTVTFFGPTHYWFADPTADAYLLFGDESALPAMAAILESLPRDARAQAFIEVLDRSDEQPIDAGPGVEVHWLHRGDAAAGDPELLETAARSVTWPVGRVKGWAAGETGVVRTLRRYFKNERELPGEDVHAMGYWRLRHTSSEADQARMEEFLAARAAGREIDDHHLIDELDD